VTHFIQIAQKLDELKSYNAMMGVLAGLNSSAISRLHQTNAHIDKRVKTVCVFD
jgi:RAS guanyl-releasing protein 3